MNISEKLLDQEMNFEEAEAIHLSKTTERQVLDNDQVSCDYAHSPIRALTEEIKQAD